MSLQIGPGRELPKTWLKYVPLMMRSFIGLPNPPRGSPTHTAAATSGVNPANHTAADSLVVQVLPAAGRHSDMAWPVRPGIGPSITPVSSAATASATPRVTTWRQSAGGTASDVP